MNIRRARLTERDEMLEVANRSFSGPDRERDFAVEVPHVWTDQRVTDHRVCTDEGRIIGMVGCYPFTVRVSGVEFRTAGIGQVCTLPEARGHGVMTALLERVTHELDGGDYDFAWLWGDRLRYGRHGWTWGGLTWKYETFARYLPDPPPEAHVDLDAAAGCDDVYEAAVSAPWAVLYSREEFRRVLNIPRTHVARYGETWLAYEEDSGGPNVLLGDGNPDELTGLIAALARAAEDTASQWKVNVFTGPSDTSLARAAAEHYWHCTTRPSACLRVCNLAGYLERAARVAEQMPCGGSGRLALHNSETGEEATVVCENGGFDVCEGAQEPCRSMTTRKLSETAFGLSPLDVTMPGLPPDSPMRVLLSIPVHINDIFCL